MKVKASSNDNPQRLYVGVDVAKADFAAATVWREQVEYWGKQPNTGSGLRGLARIRTSSRGVVLTRSICSSNRPVDWKPRWSRPLPLAGW
jgi:hypothetical protein